nr:hypothetical protein [Tanacetum cinerariifolium]
MKEKMFKHDEMTNHVGDKDLKSFDGVRIRRITKKEIKKGDEGMPKEPKKEWKLNEKMAYDVELTDSEVPITDVPSSYRPSLIRSKHIKGVVANLSRRHNHMLQAVKKNFMHKSERMKLCIAVANMMEKHTVLHKQDHDDHPNSPHAREKNVKKQNTTQRTKFAKGASSSELSIQGSKAPSSTQQQDFDALSRFKM